MGKVRTIRVAISDKQTLERYVREGALFATDEEQIRNIQEYNKKIGASNELKRRPLKHWFWKTLFCQVTDDLRNLRTQFQVVNATIQRNQSRINALQGKVRSLESQALKNRRTKLSMAGPAWGAISSALPVIRVYLEE